MAKILFNAVRMSSYESRAITFDGGVLYSWNKISLIIGIRLDAGIYIKLT